MRLLDRLPLPYDDVTLVRSSKIESLLKGERQRAFAVRQLRQFTCIRLATLLQQTWTSVCTSLRPRPP